MNIMPCKLCGSMPIVKVINYHVCNDYLSAYYITCTFCGNDGIQAHTVNEAISSWNHDNFKKKKKIA